MSTDTLQLIKLPSHFSQVQLSGLKEVVDHHHDNGCKVQFDASDVDRIDGAAVQFLLAVSKLQNGGDKPGAIIINMNEIVGNAFADMDIKGLGSSDPQEVTSAVA